MQKEGIKLIQDWRTEFGLFKQKHIGLDEPKRINMSLSLIEEEYKELSEAVKENNLVEIIDAIGDLYFVVTQMAETVGVDPHDIIEAVYKSNMSKLASTEEIAQESVALYEKLGIKAHYVLFITQNFDQKYKIIRTEDGKLLKSTEFEEPNFAKILGYY